MIMEVSVVVAVAEDKRNLKLFEIERKKLIGNFFSVPASTDCLKIFLLFSMTIDMAWIRKKI